MPHALHIMRPLSRSLRHSGVLLVPQLAQTVVPPPPPLQEGEGRRVAAPPPLLPRPRLRALPPS